jgi:hypothetical protein
MALLIMIILASSALLIFITIVELNNNLEMAYKNKMLNPLLNMLLWKILPCLHLCLFPCLLIAGSELHL